MKKEEENILNVYKKRGSVLIFAVISLMCVATLSLSFVKSCYIRKQNTTTDFKNYDMYSIGNYNDTLSVLNDYFYENNRSIEQLKERDLFINDNIELCYDNQINRFFIQYRYKGIIYRKILTLIEQNDKIIFIPQEKKYISEER